MYKRLMTLVLIIGCGTLVLAHEFWLSPRKFRLAIGEELKFNLLVGENFEGEPWDLKKHRIEKLDLHATTKVTDLRNLVKSEARDKVTLKMVEEGTQLIAMQSNYAYIELEGEKFNEYLKEDGIEDIYEQREKNNELTKPAREFYARFVKLLVQTGNKKTDVYKKKINTPIEIIPTKNPYSLKSGDYLSCQILFNGKPVINQMVKVWNKINNTTFLQNMFTEKDGTVTFPLNSKGPWMVSTVKMTKAEKAGADYQSMWSSLVFEIE
jgi:uncharacterized GH25 family protein